ncbi:hypothetical protein C8R44DRAFT_976749 [Mycena epipterygia]|nr:hypothetical protein C8R44DRAFT_976749 [Mycena epipterygia]
MLRITAPLTPIYPLESIDLPINLMVGSTALHKTIDKLFGLLTSTTPKLWLIDTITVHSDSYFSPGVKSSTLPKAPPTPPFSGMEANRFVVRGLADASHMYLRFGTEQLRREASKLKQDLKQAIVAQEEELRPARPRKRQRTDDHSKGTEPAWSSDHLSNLLTSPDDVEYDEDGGLDARTEQVLVDLFDVRSPNRDDVERQEELHAKALAVLAMLANFRSHF